MAKTEQKKFFACIMHNHSSELGTTIGRVMAINADEAFEKATLWINQQIEKHGCKSSPQNTCEAWLEEYKPGQRGLARDLMAEDIETTA